MSLATRASSTSASPWARPGSWWRRTSTRSSCRAGSHGCQMAIARFLDRMCLALRASGLWLRYAPLQNLIPSFPWIAPPRRPPPWRNPRKGRDQVLPSGNLELNPEPSLSASSSRISMMALVPSLKLKLRLPSITRHASKHRDLTSMRRAVPRGWRWLRP